MTDAEMYSRNPEAYMKATRLMDALDLAPKVCRVCGNDDPEGLSVVPNLDDPHFRCCGDEEKCEDRRPKP